MIHESGHKMGLKMPELWVNPRSTKFWFRRRVPKKYRRFGMPAEIKFSLDTTDRNEALLRCWQKNVQLEREWQANLIGLPPTQLSQMQIAALAGEFYAETVAAHRDEPGKAVDWQQASERLARRKRPFIGPLGQHLRISFGNEARAFLRSKDVNLVGERFELFVKAYVEAKAHANRTLERNASGDFRPDPDADRYPKMERSNPEYAFDVVWDQFSKAKLLSASTKKKWLPYFRALIKRVRTDDMSKVTEQHLLVWRDELIAAKVSPVSIKDGHLAAAKAFFGWAKRMKKLPVNPTVDVFIDVTSKHGKKMRGFDDKEAAIVLSAALAPMSPLMSAENAAARRWVPWICAYTGARVNEITQLRAGDVMPVDDIPCIRITPEAGTVKTDEERWVPIHSHLIEQGFLEFADRKDITTPLFYSIARQRNPDRINPTYASVGNKLAKWVRSLGIEDPSVAPNHGWRHRFKTKGRKAGMVIEVLHVIQGHAPLTEGDAYGETPPDVMLPEILKYPRYEVVAGEMRDGRRRKEIVGK